MLHLTGRRASFKSVAWSALHDLGSKTVWRDVRASPGDRSISSLSPTGSTAYNLSAGGPVIVPNAKSLVITPICAHSLAARPIVVADNDVVTLTVDSKSEEPKLSMDGVRVEVDSIDKMTVKVSEKTFKLIRTGENKFFTTLRKKLWYAQ